MSFLFSSSIEFSSSVTQALIRCCSHPLKSTVEQQLENYEPDISEENTKSLLSIGKTITYENYLPLWKTILNVTSLKEFDTSIYSIFDRQNMLVAFYDEIIDSILHIIDRLDLSVEKDQIEVRGKRKNCFDGFKKNLEGGGK